MKFIASELHSKINDYYNMVDNYSVRNDPDFTYQELILMCNAYYWNILPNNILDTDNLDSVEDEWNMCVAHLTKPMICDKEWDKVLVDRSHLSPPNLKRDKKWRPIFWYEYDEYKEIFKEEERIREEKRKLEDEKAKKEYDEWIKKKDKQNEYQRKRRALLKEKKNGTK